MYSQGRLVIPPTAQSLILQILQQYHDSPLAGHYGVARTQALVAEYFIWPGLARDVEAYVRAATRVRETKLFGMRPKGSSLLSLSLIAPGAVCPWIGSLTCHQATTTMLSWWWWIA